MPSSSFFNSLKRLSAALLLLGLSACSSNQGAPSLYTQYMSYPVVKNSIRGDVGNIFTDANKAYTNRKFKKAVNIYSEANPNLLKGNMFYGICLMETGKINEARATFELIASQNSLESPMAQWLVAMCYLKEGNNTSLIQALQKIDDENIFYKKAAKLLEDLGA